MKGESESVNEANAIRTKLSQLGIFFVAVIMISGSLGYLIGAAPPESAPDTVIDWEGLTAYKINGIRYANPDDPDSIQATIEELEATGHGGLVVVPEGDYYLNERLLITQSNLALVGTGDANIISSLGDGISSIIRIQGAYDDYIENILLRDLILVGCNNPSGNNEDGIAANYVTDLTIENCQIYNATEEGIVFYDCTYSKAVGNTLVNCGVTGVANPAIEVYQTTEYADSLCHNILIADNVVRDSPYKAIMVMDASNVTVARNVITNTTGGEAIYVYSREFAISNVIITENLIRSSSVYGINLPYEVTAPVCEYSNMVISNNVIEDCSDGIRTSRTTNSLITGNSISDCINYGIYMKWTNYTVCSQNAIIDCPVSLNTRSAILYTAGERSSILSNTIRYSEGVGQYGIYVVTDVDHVLIQNNIFERPDNLYSAIALSGNADNNTISGNTLHNDAACIVITSDTCYGNLITGNIIQCSATVNGIQNSGTATVVNNNLGYRTEAYGRAEIAASDDYITVTHSLVKAPTSVIVTLNVTGYTCKIVNIYSSTFVVYTNATVPTGCYVYWAAYVVM